MTRIRTALYELSVLVLLGAAAVATVFGVNHYIHRPTIKSFQAEYSAADARGRQEVAARYLTQFPAQDLLSALEETYKDYMCHSQAHPFGRALYAQHKNFTEAVRQCGGYCTYGCFHGVIMEVFTTESDTLGGVIEDETPEQYLTHLQRESGDICTKPEVASVVLSRQCYHGLGHVFAYTAHHDLKKSVESCAVFTDPQAEISCRSGVFMETVFNDASTTAVYAKSTQPCEVFQDRENTFMCYRYKAYGWLYVWGGIAPALKACDALGDNTMRCIVATSMAASSPSLVATDEGFEKLCSSLQGERYSMCIKGAVLKIIDLNDGDDSEHVCDAVAPSYHERCLDIRREYRAAIYYDN